LRHPRSLTDGGQCTDYDATLTQSATLAEHKTLAPTLSVIALFVLGRCRAGYARPADGGNTGGADELNRCRWMRDAGGAESKSIKVRKLLKGKAVK
jgi:hypothetical protein